MKYLILFTLLFTQVFAQKVATRDLQIIPVGNYAIEISKVSHNEIVEHSWAHLKADVALEQHNTVHCYIEYHDNASDFEHAYLKFNGQKAIFQGFEWLVEYEPQTETWVLTRCTVMPNICWCIVITKMPQQ